MSQVGANPEAAAILVREGRDQETVLRALREDGITAVLCETLPSLMESLGTSAFAIVAEEALLAADLAGIAPFIGAQPDWSDYLFIVLTERDGGPEREAPALRHREALRHVAFLERPFQPMTLLSLARTALASRRRQYQARDRLAAVEANRAEIADRDERLTFALEAGKLGSWELDLPEKTLHASARCKMNFGLRPDEDLTYERLLRTIHLEDRAIVIEAAQAAIDDRTDFDVDCRGVGPGREIRWVEVRGRAIYSGERATGMAGVSLDVTARKEAEDRQNLLIRELHHRVKNTLATVQAIIGSTARGANSIDAFYRDFTGRIMSLANTHTILTEEFWQRASLHDLLRKELGPFEDGQNRVKLSGPPVEVPSDVAVPLGMAFHELTTNAAKYGALSNAEGRVSVSWTLEAAEPGAPKTRVRLRWTEEGGPPVTPPSRRGFGTRLLERVLTAQVKADVDIDFDPRGLRVSVCFVLPEGKGRETRPVEP